MRTSSCLASAMLLGLAACGSGGSDGNGSSASSGGATQLEPGLWEMKMELVDVKGPGIPAGAAAQMKQQLARVTTDCMTPEEAKGPRSDMFTKGQAANCKQDDFSWSGGKIHGVMTCGGAGPGGEGKVTMTMDGQYGGESIEMTMKTKTEAEGGSMDMDMKITGRRVGECPAEKS
ncbi:MAG TPA: DUF3617 domain-containing protein [Allosphingosinicella sp.]